MSADDQIADDWGRSSRRTTNADRTGDGVLPYLGIEVGRINENGKTILTKRGETETTSHKTKSSRSTSLNASQSEDVMGRVRGMAYEIRGYSVSEIGRLDNSYVQRWAV